MKKTIVTIMISVFALTGMAVFAPTPAHAACGDFLGFPAWYRGLADPKTCELPKDFGKNQDPSKVVWTIVLNIIDIALRLVGIIATIMIIYGGFRYLTSAGDPSRISAAKDTIFKAIIGLVIAIVAATAVGFLVSRLNA